MRRHPGRNPCNGVTGKSGNGVPFAETEKVTLFNFDRPPPPVKIFRQTFLLPPLGLLPALCDFSFISQNKLPPGPRWKYPVTPRRLASDIHREGGEGASPPGGSHADGLRLLTPRPRHQCANTGPARRSITGRCIFKNRYVSLLASAVIGAVVVALVAQCLRSPPALHLTFRCHQLAINDVRYWPKADISELTLGNACPFSRRLQ